MDGPPLPHTGAVYYVNLQTLATTWTSPVPAPPPEDVPCATCMECPCACAARGRRRASESEAVKAHTAVPQKYSHHEDVPVDRSRQGHVMGVCVAFNRGYCRRGDDCRYEHAFTKEAREVAAATTFVDVREIPSSQIGKQPKKQPCFDLKHKGFCGRGAACPFAHTGHEGLPATRRQRKAQRAAEAQEPAAPARGSATAGARGDGAGARAAPLRRAPTLARQRRRRRGAPARARAAARAPRAAFVRRRRPPAAAAGAATPRAVVAAAGSVARVAAGPVPHRWRSEAVAVPVAVARAAFLWIMRESFCCNSRRVSCERGRRAAGAFRCGGSGQRERHRLSWKKLRAEPLERVVEQDGRRRVNGRGSHEGRRIITAAEC